ncbi:acyl-CoA dehydrogenase [Nonomuraea sp. NPDC046570]|uniref:acyl-CoA dehydrogenase n=1 Tax=Nonomuraea sp. NPDC046570 TaxID=3155255 RepID=UPI0033F93A5B
MLALLTEEQEMVRDLAGEVAESCRLANPGDQVDAAKGWAELTQAGLLGLRTREGGTPAASGVEAALVAGAFGGALAPVPYLTSGILVAELLALAGADSWLDELASGEVRYALLLTPDLKGLAGPGAQAVAWDVEGASYALGLTVDGRPCRTSLEGFSRAECADRTRPIARGTATSVEELGEPVDLDRWLALALSAVAADAAGAMRAALEGVVAYAKERIAYGVPIGSFQAIQHLCADALVQCEAAASCVAYASWAVDALDPAEALLAARTAKAYTSTEGLSVCETVMQVYGGIGQTWEHIAHYYTRRVMLDAHLLGDASDQLTKIADARLGG